MVGASKSRLYRRGIVRGEQMRQARLIHDMRVSQKKFRRPVCGEGTVHGE